MAKLHYRRQIFQTSKLESRVFQRSSMTEGSFHNKVTAHTSVTYCGGAHRVRHVKMHTSDLGSTFDLLWKLGQGADLSKVQLFHQVLLFKTAAYISKTMFMLLTRCLAPSKLFNK